MSTIIAVRLNNGFVVCSDGLAVSLNSEKIDYSNGQVKIYRVVKTNIILGFSGIKSHGDLIYKFINQNLLKKPSLKSVVVECASYVKGLNQGFSITNTAKEIVNWGFVPQTGVVICGQYGNEDIFSAITPGGKVLKPKKFVILGYSAEGISNNLRKSITSEISVSQAISVCKSAMELSSKTGFSNNEFFCMSVTNGRFQFYNNE